MLVATWLFHATPGAPGIMRSRVSSVTFAERFSDSAVSLPLDVRPVSWPAMPMATAFLSSFTPLVARMFDMAVPSTKARVAWVRPW